MMKATRLIYPQPSRKDRKKKRIMSCGTKVSTEPTPEMMPLQMRSMRKSAAPMLVSALSTPPLIHSKRVSIQPMK